MNKIKEIKSKFMKTCKRFHKAYYSYLLLFLILLFISRPYDFQSIAYEATWRLFFCGVFISAIFNSNHHPIVKRSAVILGFIAICMNWLEFFYPTHLLFLLTLIFAIAFMVLCTISVVRDVILRARVTLETLRGVICAYFMVAFVFGYAYFLIEYLEPGSFLLFEHPAITDLRGNYFSQLMYFSFVTLLTIGYGDITPVYGLGQTITVIEGILGQFYIAILVSRIVAVYSLGSKLSSLIKEKK